LVFLQAQPAAAAALQAAVPLQLQHQSAISASQPQPLIPASSMVLLPPPQLCHSHTNLLVLQREQHQQHLQRWQEV
jgi:hypothetical protein